MNGEEGAWAGLRPYRQRGQPDLSQVTLDLNQRGERGAQLSIVGAVGDIVCETEISNRVDEAKVGEQGAKQACGSSVARRVSAGAVGGEAGVIVGAMGVIEAVLIGLTGAEVGASQAGLAAQIHALDPSVVAVVGGWDGGDEVVSSDDERTLNDIEFDRIAFERDERLCTAIGVAALTELGPGAEPLTRRHAHVGDVQVSAEVVALVRARAGAVTSSEQSSSEAQRRTVPGPVAEGSPHEPQYSPSSSPFGPSPVTSGCSPALSSQKGPPMKERACER